MCQYSDKTNNFDFMGPNLPKNGFWGGNFKNLCLDLYSTPPRYHMWQFSAKMDDFEFFCLNLRKLPNHLRYFGLNIFEGVADTWVEAKISWVEVEMSYMWMEQGGAGWSWVHGLVIPI